MERLVRKFQMEWKMKTPKQKWLTIYYIPAKLSETLGMNTLTDLRVYWLSYSGMVITVIHYSAIINTVLFYYKNGELLMILQCLSSIGIFVSVS